MDFGVDQHAADVDAHAGVEQPEWKDFTDIDSAAAFARSVGYPVIVRPSYVLSGAAMAVVHSEEDLGSFIDQAALVGKNAPVVALAGAFGAFRSASPYEVRGESMANDIADGLTPEVIRRFRQSILALRKDPKLADELFKRMVAVYARILPGLGVKAAEVEGGIYYVIGPEKQFSAYEEYLKTVEGPGVRLRRIYPRDYWMPLK